MIKKNTYNNELLKKLHNSLTKDYEKIKDNANKLEPYDLNNVRLLRDKTKKMIDNLSTLVLCFDNIREE